MKRIFGVIITIATLLSMVLCGPVRAQEMLSNMSESECIDFVKQHNIEIPDDYEESIWGPFIKDVICIVEENPNYEFAINYTVTREFAESIKQAVNDYYGVASSSGDTQEASSTFSMTYRLRDSEVVTPWTSILGTFNCYIYMQ